MALETWWRSDERPEIAPLPGLRIEVGRNIDQIARLTNSNPPMSEPESRPTERLAGLATGTARHNLAPAFLVDRTATPASVAPMDLRVDPLTKLSK